MRHFHGLEVAKPIPSCSISCLHVTSCRAKLHLARVHVKGVNIMSFTNFEQSSGVESA